MARPHERARVQLSEIPNILKDCCRAGGVQYGEGYWEEHRSRLDEFLDNHKTVGGHVFRLYGDRLGRTLYKRSRFYNMGGLVITRVRLVLDSQDWDSLLPFSGLFFHGLYFEECTIEAPPRGKEYISATFASRLYFRQTEFVSSLRNKGTRRPAHPPGLGSVASTWIMNFSRGASVSIESCDFGEDSVQIRCLYSGKDDVVEEVESDGVTGYVFKDDRYTEAKLREAHSISDAVPVHLPFMSTPAVGLESLEFVSNRGIGALNLISSTRDFVLRGGNELQDLRLPEGGAFWASLRMYMGLFEVIDPEFRTPFRHRDLFLRLRALASVNQDRLLLRSSTAQIDRVEHFLIKQDPVAISDGVRPFVDHWQRRMILGWEFLCSNFNRSWARCVLFFVAFYLLTNLLAYIPVAQQLGWIEFWSVVFRPVQRIPFLAQTIEELYSGPWMSIPTASRVWVNAIGLLQSMVGALFTFSLVRSLRR